MNVACPIDGAPLMASAAALRCAHGHAYDRAREGYVNLLLPQHKASRDPGDSAVMVASRRRVLDSGVYDPIARRMFECVRAMSARIAKDDVVRIVDAGCGEGRTLDKLRAAAEACDAVGCWELAGLDISKWAILAAAKRYHGVIWVVGNNRYMPFVPGSVDIILSMFGFPVWEGFKPAQREGAHVVLVDPGSDHLIELRSVIYPAVIRSGPPSLDAAVRAGYQPVLQETLCYATELQSAAAINDLLAMTPHYYRMGEAGRQALAQLQRARVTIDVVFRVLRLAS